MLHDRRECADDEMLVHQVRVQLIDKKVAAAAWNDVSLEIAGTSKPPLSFFLQALRSQLQRIKSSCTPNLEESGELTPLKMVLSWI